MPASSVKSEDRPRHDLAADPKEANDLAQKEAPRTAAMRKQLEAWLKSVAASLNGADYAP